MAKKSLTKLKVTNQSSAEERFVERMARVLIEQLKNEDGAKNEKQVKHQTKIVE